MAIGDYDAVDRAARRLREEPEPGWAALEQSVVAAVRATPRAGWPIDVDDPQPGTPGRLRVGDLAISAHLSRALAGDPDFVVTDIAVVSDDGVLQAVSVSLSGRYRTDLVAAAHRARRAVDTVLADTIGSRPEARITVTVHDVHN